MSLLSWAGNLAVTAGSDHLKVAADLPGSLHDRVYRYLVRSGIVPTGILGRIALAEAIVVGGSMLELLEKRTGTHGIVRFVIRELAADARVELAKRIIAAEPVPLPRPAGPLRIAERLDSFTASLFPILGRKERSAS